MAPNVGQIMSFLNAAKGSTTRFTVSKSAMLHLLGQSNDDVAKALINGLSNLKNPTLEIAAKSSKQGYTIAGMVLKDGTTQIGKGALSVTGAGKPDAVFKTKFSLFGDTLQAGGHLQLSKSPDIDNCIANLSVRNGILTASGVHNNGRSYGCFNVKKFSDYFEPGLYNKMIARINQPAAHYTQAFRNLITG